VVARQIQYEWDDLCGSPDLFGGRARLCQIPALNQDRDRRYLEDLAMTDPDGIHVLIRDPEPPACFVVAEMVSLMSCQTRANHSSASAA
jgi:hypothetical protein